jgi:hypothetical protein
LNIHPNWAFWFENKPSGNPDSIDSSAIDFSTTKKNRKKYVPDIFYVIVNGIGKLKFDFMKGRFNFNFKRQILK